MNKDMAQRRGQGNGVSLHELQLREMRREMEEERAAPRSAPARGAPPRRARMTAAPPGLAHAQFEGEPPAIAGSNGGMMRRTDMGKSIDVHELLKGQAFATDSPSCDSHFEKNRPCPSNVYGISDQYIVLDSFYKDATSSNPEKGEFHWNFMIQGATSDQNIGVSDKLDNVVEIQMAAFSLPIPEEVPYVLRTAPITPTGNNQLVLSQNNDNPLPPYNPRLLPAQYPASVPAQSPWVNNPYSQLPCGNRITVWYKEAGRQSYIDINGGRHHYEFVATYPSSLGANPNQLVAIPLDGRRWDAFIFTEPLPDVPGMTLVFRTPNNPLSLRQDVLEAVTVTSDGAPANGPYLVFGYTNHGLNVGDRIFVKGFKSGIDVLDAYINRDNGHVASGDPTQPAMLPSTPIPELNRFWLDPAVSIIDMTNPAPVLPQLVTVYVAKRRLRISVRLRRVVDRLTNYMTPVS